VFELMSIAKCNAMFQSDIQPSLVAVNSESQRESRYNSLDYRTGMVILRFCNKHPNFELAGPVSGKGLQINKLLKISI